MVTIHSRSVTRQKHLTDITVFSGAPIDEITFENLSKAQLVAESMWLNQPPLLAFRFDMDEVPDEMKDECVRLFDEVYYLKPSGYGLIDSEANEFLINARLSKLGGNTYDGTPPFSSGTELLQTLQDHPLVVVMFDISEVCRLT